MWSDSNIHTQHSNSAVSKHMRPTVKFWQRNEVNANQDSVLDFCEKQKITISEWGRQKLKTEDCCVLELKWNKAHGINVELVHRKTILFLCNNNNNYNNLGLHPQHLYKETKLLYLFHWLFKQLMTVYCHFQIMSPLKKNLKNSSKTIIKIGLVSDVIGRNLTQLNLLCVK